MSNLREAAEAALEAMEINQYTVAELAPHKVVMKFNDAMTTLRAALAKADEDRAWVEERKANWAEDKALARRNALEEADRIRKAEEEGRCWACGQKAEPEQEPVVDCPRCGHCCPQQTAEQEPVAWMDRDGDVYPMPENKNWAPPHTMLYTAPPQRFPLTDEEIEQIADGIPVDDFVGPTTWHLKLARAIEVAHGIGEKK